MPKQANSSHKRENSDFSENLSAQPPESSNSGKRWSDFRVCLRTVIMASPARMPTLAGLELTVLPADLTFDVIQTRPFLKKSKNDFSRFHRLEETTRISVLKTENVTI